MGLKILAREILINQGTSEFLRPIPEVVEQGWGKSTVGVSEHCTQVTEQAESIRTSEWTLATGTLEGAQGWWLERWLSG